MLDLWEVHNYVDRAKEYGIELAITQYYDFAEEYLRLSKKPINEALDDTEYRRFIKEHRNIEIAMAIQAKKNIERLAP